MREAFGGAFLIKLVIIFIVIYVSILAVAVVYAKTFKVKNMVINILEEYEDLDLVITRGFDNLPAIENETILGTRLRQYGYDLTTRNLCEDGETPEGNRIACFKGVRIEEVESNSPTTPGTYYKVAAYMVTDVPILGAIIPPIPITGETKVMYRWYSQ